MGEAAGALGLADGVGVDGPPPAAAAVATAMETPSVTTPAAIARAVRCLMVAIGWILLSLGAEQTVAQAA
ncbi:hypothetical protein ADL12_09910 [Streptomyces regalis]|uniref:Uncharacterized protein n=1 Tax=Streptomyces regalis TaxID=68262 RepID=A0A0X3VCU5_9ACTN|nr:hypothetical protein ADL12_09910 [Streptomyces regalis]